jgi:hypothetical protein
MTATVQERSATVTTTRARRSWSRPRIECLETRPEVTAYSGAGGPWLSINR